MKLPAAAIATACLVHLVLISRASNEACEEDSLLQTWQEKSASYGHITADQLKEDAVCQGPVVKPDYQCFSRVIIPDPRKVQYGYCLNGEFHMCGYNNPSSCDSTRRPPCVHQPTLAPPTTTTTTFAGEVLELKTSWKIGSTWNFACLTYNALFPSRTVYGTRCSGAAYQLWGIPAGEDRLQFMVNGLCLTAVDAPANNLTDVLHKNVVLDPCDSGSTAQQFQWQENGIVKLGTDNLCLDWDVAGIYEKDNVYMYTCNGQTNQVWYQILQLGRLQTSWKFNSGRVELRCLTYNEHTDSDVQGGGCDLAPSVFRSKTQHHAQMFVESGPQFLCLTAYPFENLLSWNDTLKLMRKKEVDLSPCDASNSAQAFEMTKSTQIKLQNDSGLCLDWNVGGKFGRPDDIYLFGCTPNSNQRWTQLS